MSTLRRSAGAMLAAAAIALSGLAIETTGAAATEVRVIVNNAPITTFDVQRRAAFLRLQRSGGDVNQKALDEMIDQTLRMQEMARLNVRVATEEVDQAYARFASQNNLSTAQLDQILNQSGVTPAHFREFIRAQIGWGQAIAARARFESGGQLTDQQVVRKIREERGGQKPVATEYVLQQVIFVVPAAERGARLAQRKREAEAMRGRVSSCETTREVVRGTIDVTVRDLGRVLEPELPPDWEQQVKATQPGRTTVVRETERGAEFLAVCSTRQVSDDHVAKLVFQAETATEAGEELSAKYTTELRERANIVRR